MNTNIPAPGMVQAIHAVRQRDCDGERHWFCATTGSRIQVREGRSGRYFCPGCNCVAPRIEPVRSYRATP